MPKLSPPQTQAFCLPRTQETRSLFNQLCSACSCQLYINYTQLNSISNIAIDLLGLNQSLYYPADQCTDCVEVHWLHYWTCSTQPDNLNLFSLLCNATIALGLSKTVWHVALRLYDNDTKQPIFTFISNSCWTVEATIFMKAIQADETILSVLWRADFSGVPPKHLDSSCRLQSILVFLSSFAQASWLQPHPPVPKAILPAFNLFPLL